MFDGHNPYLVALSVMVAVLGGYTGFGLAARVRGSPNVSRRLLLASAAGFLAVGIWTMHFVGMLAAPIPDGTDYLVLPTVVSFLICALVVGVSLFFVSVGEPSEARVVASAILLGTGIVSMHYVGIHGLEGSFHIEHSPGMVTLAALIAVGTGYGGLKVFLAGHGGHRLVFSAAAFGVAVSGMHYTAMYGMRFRSMPEASHDGLVASTQVLSLVVALLCFLIVAGFLLFLVPDPYPRAAAVSGAFDEPSAPRNVAEPMEGRAETPGPALLSAQRPLPLGGLGQPRPPTVSRLPIEGADGMHFIDVAEVRGVRADAHYTLIHDGTRERMCPWSISEAEAQLDPVSFMRVHRSHIVSIPHVILLRKEGDGAVVELDGADPHLVPVSRPKIAELKARLGLIRRSAHPNHAAIRS